MRTTPAMLERISIGTTATISCTGCGEVLDLHQPDVEQPDRLLGICPECRTWFLIDHEAHMMLALPDVRALRVR